MKQTKDHSLKAIRHMLASIDLSDIKEEKDMTDAERKGYCAQVFAVFPVIEKDIKKFLHAQLMFISNEAATMEQVSFGRGTFNGMDLLLEHWKKAAAEHTVPKDPENFDKNNPMPEIL